MGYVVEIVGSMKLSYNFVPFLYETPYLIENLQIMGSKDEAPDTDADVYDARRRYVMSNSSTNTGHGNWFRSIPRRIRKFISKQSRLSNKHLEQTTNDLAKLSTTASTDPNDSADSLNEANLYLNLDRNDEDVAMIRATAQMARYIDRLIAIQSQ